VYLLTFMHVLIAYRLKQIWNIVLLCLLIRYVGRVIMN